MNLTCSLRAASPCLPSANNLQLRAALRSATPFLTTTNTQRSQQVILLQNLTNTRLTCKSMAHPCTGATHLKVKTAQTTRTMMHTSVVVAIQTTSAEDYKKQLTQHARQTLACVTPLYRITQIIGSSLDLQLSGGCWCVRCVNLFRQRGLARLMHVAASQWLARSPWYDKHLHQRPGPRHAP